jgi:hypothetical protein
VTGQRCSDARPRRRAARPRQPALSVYLARYRQWGDRRWDALSGTAHATRARLEEGSNISGESSEVAGVAGAPQAVASTIETTTVVAGPTSAMVAATSNRTSNGRETTEELFVTFVAQPRWSRRYRSALRLWGLVGVSDRHDHAGVGRDGYGRFRRLQSACGAASSARAVRMSNGSIRPDVPQPMKASSGSPADSRAATISASTSSTVIPRLVASAAKRAASSSGRFTVRVTTQLVGTTTRRAQPQPWTWRERRRGGRRRHVPSA